MLTYHVSNPVNRDSIQNIGLIPNLGFSTKYNHGDDFSPVIFLSTTYEDKYDSTYDDDIYQVDLTGYCYHYDPKKPNKTWIFVNKPILFHRISLIYTGTFS